MAPMLLAPEIGRRLPVWCALSDFFLDSETTPHTLRTVAHAAQTSGYTRGELWLILAAEVAPAFYDNLRAPIGEWALWPPADVEQRVRAVLVRGSRPAHRLPPVRTAYCAAMWCRLQPYLHDAAVPPSTPADGTPSCTGDVVRQLLQAAPRNLPGRLWVYLWAPLMRTVHRAARQSVAPEMKQYPQ